jgi:hypothetical protein
VKAALLALGLALVAATGVAEAHSSCHEVSKVMGYSHCRRFAAWSTPFSVFTEAGASVLHFDADGLAQQLHATVGTWRSAVAIGWFYIGDELGFGAITSGPSGATPTITFASEQPPTSTGGIVIQDQLIVGARSTAGPLSFGAELGIGFRIADVSSPALTGPSYDQPDAAFLLTVRAKADLWANTWLTVGGLAAVSVLDRHDVMLGLTVGLHLVPYDGLR